MKERILELIRINELTAWKFAEILKVQPSSISHIIAGRNKPSFDFIEKILTTYPDVNPDWLILGKGEMYRAKQDSEEVNSDDSEILDDNTLFTYVKDGENTAEQRNITNVIRTNELINEEISTNTNEIEKVVVFYKNNKFSVYEPM